jgi:hypothetical protein
MNATGTLGEPEGPPLPINRTCPYCSGAERNEGRASAQGGLGDEVPQTTN